MSRKRKDLWYKEGLYFECTQCGACCTGTPGLVAFTLREADEMADELDMSRDEFLERYARPTDQEDVWDLREIETPPHGHDCVLLERDEETGVTRCIAHDARPMQCRTWPFWPDNMRNRKSWERAGRRCEGINRGTLIPLRVIQSEMRRTPDWGECP